MFFKLFILRLFANLVVIIHTLLQIHEIQLSFSRVANDINFGPIIIKMQTTFDKYFLSMSITFYYGMLINPYMKELRINIIFKLLYSELHNKVIQCKHELCRYFILLFEEYNTKF